MSLLPVPDADVPDAVRVGDAALSTEQLRAAAHAVADRIAGAPAVAVDATPSLETIVAVLGGLLAGVPVVPVPADAGTTERRHILCDSQAALLLTTGPSAQPGNTAAVAGDSQRAGRGVTGHQTHERTRGRTHEADSAGLPVVPVDLAARSDSRHPEPDGASTALIMYTSGTTGAPKGVALSRNAIAADLDALAEAWAWTPEDTLVHGLPLYHVHGLVLGVLGALRVGSRLVHTVRPTPEAYAAAGGSLYFGVPTVWSRVCRDAAAARALARARLLVSGSAPLPVPVFESLTALTGHRPIERYGMTETLITVSTRADGERRPGTVGIPVRGVTTRLVTDDRTTPHPGEIGELQVRGPTLFDGYVGRPADTAAAYTDDGWFRTGDIATIDHDGMHRIVGRASRDLIKSGGFRIGAGEVENALLAHPGVREAAVVGVPDDDLGQRVVAYVVASGVTPEDLIEYAAGHLSRHKRPRQVILVDSLPRNAMGKVQKHLLTT